MVQDAFLGPATVAPTLYTTDQVSANVIPGRVEIILDWREIPAESPEDILSRLQQLLDGSLVDGCEGDLIQRDITATTWTGQEHTWPRVSPAFCVPAEGPLVTTAQAALQDLYGRKVQVGHWQFATDGGHLMKAGVRCVGFAPGDETLVHTTQEHISIDEMVLGMAGNMALALELGQL
jgi:acetylornithine deacetylase/succinyl-diaminopimelate desuccinylase-like protein